MMPDREEVKYAMDCLLFGVDSKSSCKKCAYFNGIAKSCSILTIMHDAFELLKEQEPVKPREEKCGKHWDLDVWTYVCGECGSAIDTVDVYCRHCGRKVKWE